MPHCLIIVLAPRVVLMNDDGDIVIQRSQGENSLSREFEYIDGLVVAVAPKGFKYEVDIKNYLNQTLANLYMQDYVYSRPNVLEDERKNSIQAMLICEKGRSVDMIMAKLSHIGIGSLVGSINVIGLESSKFYKPPKQDIGDVESDVEANRTSLGSNHGGHDSEAAKKKMFLEVASKIRVEQVVEIIESGAQFSFDYLALLTVSSAIAGIGLATNNTVLIVASMLVSPIMGPVLALTFGSLIHDWNLTMLGLKHELTSLLICLGMGFVIGLFSIGIGTDGSWPSAEMKSRGVINSLAIGFAVAIFSGIGVALSVLGNNNASLIGVAISASLLPPAVNCGIAFAYALCGFPLDSGALDDDNHQFSDAGSYFKLGGVSLCLTMINIGAIYLSALVMFRLKEVAPVSTQTAFWHEDIKLSRGWNLSSTVTSSDKPTSPQDALPLSSVSREPTEGDVTPSIPPPQTAPAAKEGLELQSFESNPILQEEFLRSRIGQTVMTTDTLLLTVGTAAGTGFPQIPVSKSPAAKQRFLNILRQDSLNDFPQNDQDQLDSSQHESPHAQIIKKSFSGDARPVSPKHNSSTPDCDKSATLSARPGMRRGSKSAKMLSQEGGARNQPVHTGSYSDDVDLDEIKERLRIDAQLLSSSTSSLSLPPPMTPQISSEKKSKVI